MLSFQAYKSQSMIESMTMMILRPDTKSISTSARGWMHSNGAFAHLNGMKKRGPTEQDHSTSTFSKDQTSWATPVSSTCHQTSHSWWRTISTSTSYSKRVSRIGLSLTSQRSTCASAESLVSSQSLHVHLPIWVTRVNWTSKAISNKLRHTLRCALRTMIWKSK